MSIPTHYLERKYLMAHKFEMHPAMGMLTNADFRDTTSLAEAARSNLLSTSFPDNRGVKCEVAGVRQGSGVRITYKTTFEGLDTAKGFVHKFYFIDRHESRERTHVVEPSHPVATTELLVLLPEQTKKDYFNASVYDSEGKIVHTDSIVFNDKGQTVTYPFSEEYVSPLPVHSASLREEIGADGRPVACFKVQFEELSEEIEVNMFWEAIGTIRKETIICSSDKLVASLELPLIDNPEAMACDWVAIAVDSQHRVIAQTSFALQ